MPLILSDITSLADQSINPRRLWDSLSTNYETQSVAEGPLMWILNQITILLQ